MWNSCLNKFLINRKFCCHDGVISRCKYCIHTICDQCICRKLDFIGSRSGTFYIFDSLLIQVIFCFLDRCCGGVLSYIIKKTDFLYIRILCLDQFHDRRSIQIITGSCNICSRSIQRIYKAGANRIRYCGENNRCITSLCSRLHTHCHRCSHTYHQVNVICLEIGNDLFHNTGICIAVIIGYIKCDTFFFADLFQTGLDIVYDLVQGSIIYIIADTYFKILCHNRAGHHHTCCCYCCCDY